MQNKQPPSFYLNNELQFLIACCQTEPDLGKIRNTESGIENWEEKVALSARHGVLPLIYKTLNTLNTKLQSDSLGTLLSGLKPRYMSTVQKNMLMTAELIRVMNLLKENDIDALAFKGPALSQIAYGDITLRQFGDLDILIKKEDMKKVEELCISMGYVAYYDLTEVQKDAWYSYTKDMVFYHPKKNSIIEIHWLLLDADYPLQVNLDTLWGNTEIVEINKQAIQTFDKNTLLLYLCIHGSKHLWERIAWIKDIDQMIRTQDINWKNILVDAQKNHFQNMLFLGLYLSKSLFNTPLPINVQKILESAIILPELSSLVFKNWEDTLTIFENTKTTLKFFPTLKMKVLYLHKIILKPSNNEYRFIDLPREL